MFCLRLSLPGRHGFSQTCRKARLRRRALRFGPPRRTHLPGTSRLSFLRLCSRQLLLIRFSWHHKYVTPVSDGSMGSDWWISGAAFSAALDGYPPDVRSVLLSHPCRFRGSSTMGMEDGPLGQLFGVGHRTDRCQGDVGECIQRSSVRPTRSVRPTGMAVSMDRGGVWRSAFSGTQAPASGPSFAATALSSLGDRLSFLALDFNQERPRSNDSIMAVR